jgi:hypothetical protein
MLVRLCAAYAAMVLQKATVGRLFAAAMLAMLTSACITTALFPVASADPSNPSARVRPLKYHPILGAYVRQRPVEPATPQPKP